MGLKSSFIFVSMVLIAVISSGCVGNEPKLETSEEQLILEENESTELGFRVENTYNQTKSFNVTVKPQNTSSKYVNIPFKGENYKLGDATTESFTSWKYIKIKGFTKNVDASAVAINLHLDAYAEGINKSITNKTVKIELSQ